MIGKIICDLAPSADNNRNSEGGFVTLKDGRILFVYSRYGSDGFDDGCSADLYGVISADDGRSFSEPFPVLTHEQVKADNVMSVSFLRMENGDLGMFYLAKRDADQCLPYLVRSADEGRTWGEPVVCTGLKGYHVVNNDRVIRLKNGRILIPAALHGAGCEVRNGKKILTRLDPGVLYIFASDDDGRSWYTLADGIALPQCNGCTTGVQEPGVIQLEDGRIWCVIRNDSGRQYESFSSDNGRSWTDPMPSRFTSAVSPMTLRRLSDGRLLVAWNPIPLYNGRSAHTDGFWHGGRTPMVIAVSEDDGKTFGPYKFVETDENSGFCYIAIHETADGSVLLGYCAGGPGDGCCLNRLRLRRIGREEL